MTTAQNCANAYVTVTITFAAEVTCDAKNHLIMQFFINAFYSDISSSDDTVTDESDIGFSSESDFEEYLSKRPSILLFSDESD